VSLCDKVPHGANFFCALGALQEAQDLRFRSQFFLLMFELQKMLVFGSRAPDAQIEVSGSSYRMTAIL
jgi:hypothetical protein